MNTLLTLEVPERLAERLRAAAQASGEDFNHFAVARLENVLAVAEEEAEAVEGIREGLEQMRAGKGRSLDEFHKEMTAELANGRTVKPSGQ